MPVNGHSVGRDISFVVSLPNGGTLTLSGRTDYSIKPMFTDLKHKGLDGVTEFGEIPDGWQISMRLDRRTPEVDDYFARLEADYFAGVNNPAGTIYETIREIDGSITQFRYTGVVLKYDGAGDWKGDTLIPISVTAMASRRIKVA